jgi:phosphatidylethanolamine/phosphatidyl-N-methylethanolamine N-methyltransferase
MVISTQNSLPNVSKEPTPKKHHERFLFLKKVIKNPKNMGAIVPSSQNLGQYISKHIPNDPNHFIVEIGAGTGSLTHSLIKDGVCKSRLIAIELDTELAKLLTVKFQDLTVINGNATELSKILPPTWIGKVGTIVSGIPMVNLSKEEQRSIIDSCLKVLSPGGQILQFTYGFVSPLSTKSFNLTSQKLGRVLMNVPPASWWRFSRSLSSHHAQQQNVSNFNKVRNKLKRVLTSNFL